MQVALAREQVAIIRVRLAAALSELKNKTGYQALLATCKDPKAEPTLRIQAADALLQKQDADCFNDVLEIAEQDHNLQTQDLAIRYFSKLMDAPDDKRSRLQAVLIRNLRSQDPNNQERAGESLTRFGDASAVERLELAAKSEKNPRTRKHLQDDVAKLQQRIRMGGKPR